MHAINIAHNYTRPTVYLKLRIFISTENYECEIILLYYAISNVLRVTQIHPVSRLCTSTMHPRCRGVVIYAVCRCG